MKEWLAAAREYAEGYGFQVIQQKKKLEMIGIYEKNLVCTRYFYICFQKDQVLVPEKVRKCLDGGTISKHLHTAFVLLGKGFYDKIIKYHL